MITIDFETRSELDIKKVGAWKYSYHPSTEVLCMAWLYPYEKINRIKLITQFKTFPFANICRLEFEAHNAFFEYAIWHNIMVSRYNWPCIPANQWYCSAAKAAYYGLPRSLKDAAQAMNLSVQKNTEGHRLMLQISKPRPNWKNNQLGPKWFDDKKRLDQLYEYCKQDVKTEYALSQALDDLPKTERKIWLLDQIINRRGIYCDIELAQSAIQIIETLENRAKDELQKITNKEITSPGQIEKIIKFLQKNEIILPNLRANTIEEKLQKEIHPIARRILEIRQLHSKASTKKFFAMLNRTDSDCRIRDILLYHGAHTGRWSGIGIQPQNYYRPNFSNTEIEFLIIPAIKQKNIEKLTWLFGDPISPLSSILRSTLCAAPNKDLIGADYISIETCVLFWLIDDTETLKLIEQGIDLYIDMASTIYEKPHVQITESQRQLGKRAILGLGYGMGIDKFYQTCLNYKIKIDYALAEKTVKLYRRKYPKIVQYWRSINKRALQKSKPFSMHNNFLRLQLPSGRFLHYKDPELKLNRFNEIGLTYMGLNSITHKWERQETFGGKLTENIVQAIARDIMVLGMLRLEKVGYPIILTVHDEVIAEIDKNFGSVDEFVSLLCRRPKWAKNCPIKAKGWRGKNWLY